MKEVWIEGRKFILYNPLTESQLKAIDDGSRLPGKFIQDLLAGREPDRALVNKQPILWTKMVVAAVAKGFEISDEEMHKMKIGDIRFLYDKLIQYSKKIKRQAAFFA